ncbi:hypothetical protein PR048_013815 [Dryococelus australis]|uniref:Uncharacterized protein n=1 Tax=Dryococelus australis TaxID=614101 RepID=A0ABQ9HT86_9NEOP|nr:hypothetical protein PR048_013815 [Dryococelus australis]
MSASRNPAALSPQTPTSHPSTRTLVIVSCFITFITPNAWLQVTTDGAVKYEQEPSKKIGTTEPKLTFNQAGKICKATKLTKQQLWGKCSSYFSGLVLGVVQLNRDHVLHLATCAKGVESCGKLGLLHYYEGLYRAKFKLDTRAQCNVLTTSIASKYECQSLPSKTRYLVVVTVFGDDNVRRVPANQLREFAQVSTRLEVGSGRKAQTKGSCAPCFREAMHDDRLSARYTMKHIRTPKLGYYGSPACLRLTFAHRKCALAQSDGKCLIWWDRAESEKYSTGLSNHSADDSTMWHLTTWNFGISPQHFHSGQFSLGTPN